MVGQTISHYQILERLGAGGMGVVYRARDAHLDRFVAIKVLPAGALGGEAARKLFRKEALALSKLNHPNIATIHDFDTQKDVDFLVMEYIPGVTLSKKLVIPKRTAGHFGSSAIRRRASCGRSTACGNSSWHRRNRLPNSVA